METGEEEPRGEEDGEGEEPEGRRCDLLLVVVVEEEGSESRGMKGGGGGNGLVWYKKPASRPIMNKMRISRRRRAVPARAPRWIHQFNGRGTGVWVALPENVESTKGRMGCDGVNVLSNDVEKGVNATDWVGSLEDGVNVLSNDAKSANSDALHTEFAGHDKHSELPVVFLNVPIGQSEQLSIDGLMV